MANLLQRNSLLCFKTRPLHYPGQHIRDSLYLVLGEEVILRPGNRHNVTIRSQHHMRLLDVETHRSHCIRKREGLPTSFKQEEQRSSTNMRHLLGEI